MVAAPGKAFAENAVGMAALLAGPANVVMQLSRPAVGYGVVESKVESGQLTRHPWKRLRTTLTYLAVAMMGDEDERAAFRDAVNVAHRPVHASPDSPIAYNAFDPELQKWVAACLYQGAEEVHRRLHGDWPDEAAAEAYYEEAARFATTLQVRRDQWPADRESFEKYWQEACQNLEIPDAVKEYLWGVIRLTFLPAPIRWAQAPINQFLVTGFLPPPFRAAMGLQWDDRSERVFTALTGTVGWISRKTPAPVRLFPLNACLWDMRIRRRMGRPLL